MKQMIRLLAPLALALVTAPSVAWATTIECKTDPVPAAGFEADAKAQWTANVTTLYGAAWANIGLAKNWHQMWNPIAVIATWTGIPCRQVADPGKPIIFDSKAAVRR